ncbi:MAG TPA: hypothetical protein PK624_12675 [Spirochaetota bacterium]|nr:hypothetical protein [Spirochaetota bacterium]HOR45639.1 hypothetical protein [Spirochaetota bacterium]HPK57302.1 hypothetical protein [Spirochaetota bacterium]
MFQNVYVRKMQVYGFTIGILLICLMTVNKLCDDYSYSKYIKYEINNYFRDIKIQKIIIYNGSQINSGSQLNNDDIKNEITELSIINDFIESINKSYEDYPNHPQYHIRYYVRVILDNNETYDFICKFMRSDPEKVYFDDLNNRNTGPLRSQSLRRWFYKNKIY